MNGLFFLRDVLLLIICAALASPVLGVLWLWHVVTTWIPNKVKRYCNVG